MYKHYNTEDEVTRLLVSVRYEEFQRLPCLGSVHLEREMQKRKKEKKERKRKKKEPKKERETERKNDK